MGQTCYPKGFFHSECRFECLMLCFLNLECVQGSFACKASTTPLDLPGHVNAYLRTVPLWRLV